ncbi:MAG TPA: CAP domain-containing protein [Ilumatobacteraceae bacterium]|nr:CAP domain-containing protein [Ilumatobacteraceae bacterium]
MTDRGSAGTGVVVAGLTFGLASMITLGAWSLGAFGMENTEQADAAADGTTTVYTTQADVQVVDESSSTTSTTMVAPTSAAATTTVAPPQPTVAPAPRPINQPSSGGGGGGGGGSTGGGGGGGGVPDDGSCYTSSITSINNVRANEGQGPLGRMSNAKACAWAKQLAANGKLSHNAPDCGSSGGQVVGYVHRTGPGNESSAAGIIINGWFNSPSHYQVLTWPTLNRIGLAFYLETFPDGSWTVWGVGNLCP